MIYKDSKFSSFLTLLIVLATITGCNSQQSSVSLSPNNLEIQKKTIIAVGDSLTAGYNLPIDEAYPAILNELIQEKGYNYEVQNAGVSGETSKGTLSRIDWILNAKPDIVILETGGNDALRGLETDELSSNLQQIIDKLQENNVSILLTGLKAPRNMGPSYTSKFDQVYPFLAEKNDVPFMPFFLEDVALNPNLNQDDGIHPNKEGNRIIAENVLSYLENLL